MYPAGLRAFAVAPPPGRESSGGGSPPEDDLDYGGGGGDRDRDRLLVLLGVYVRQRLRDRRGRRLSGGVSLSRVKQACKLPTHYVEELAEELVEDGYLAYRPDPRPRIMRSEKFPGILGSVLPSRDRPPHDSGSSETTEATEPVFVSLTDLSLYYQDLDRACEELLRGAKRKEEVLHHLLNMPERFVADLRSEDVELRDYARSTAITISVFGFTSVFGSVALALELLL